MTSADWTTSELPEAMLDAAAKLGPIRDEELLEFACACVRYAEPPIPNGEFLIRKLAEWRQTPGATASPPTWLTMFGSFLGGDVAGALVQMMLVSKVGLLASTKQIAGLIRQAEHVARTPRSAEVPLSPAPPTHARQAHWLREILGDPFRTLEWNPAWRTETVRELARMIRTHNAFDMMPLLADALEDAGCAEFSILDHARGDGPHDAACWVLRGC
ncbi:MAG: hypothetical protein ACRCZF_13625 [Gemmataceae bacterium]